MPLLPFVALALAAPTQDYVQPQSPPRPAPAWLRIIDQGQYDPRLKGYFTPAGLKVEIVADFPTVINPVGMTFAADGTFYVLEWRPSPGDEWREHPETITYKDGSKRVIATMKKKVKDVVKVLRHTGEREASAPWYDTSQVVLEDELPSSILVHDGWLYLTGRGTVRRWRLDALDQPPKIIARGFCGFHHHQVSGLTIGNDGWLYITSGDDDNVVEGSDGSRATVLRTGAVFRCRPDGSRMHVYSIGYRNPYRDVAFDTAFNMFHADNDNEDGSKFTGCRLMHVAEGSDFGWRLKAGARCCTPDPIRGAVFGELPGKLPPLLKTGRGSPAGLLIYNDTRFPEPYRGLLYYPDVFRKLVRAYRVEPAGATFQMAEEFELMKSDDPLFRPCQMIVGPDGAMYVCDWRTNSGGAGQLWGDMRHGRIYRLSWAGDGKAPAIPLRGLDSWAKVERQSDDDLLKTLAAPEFSDRLVARHELVRRGGRDRALLLRRLGDRDQPLRARIAALGVLESLWNDEVRDAVLELLTVDAADLRRLAADGLALNCRPGDEKAGAALLEALNDADPAVKRAVALAMSHLGGEAAADPLVNTLAADDGKDVYLRDSLVRAIENLGKPGIARLVALAESGVDRDRDRAVEAFLGLRTRRAAEAIPLLLANPHLTIDQRAALVRSYSNYLLDPPVSLGPLLGYLAKHDEAHAVKLAGLDVLSAAGALRDEKAEKWLLALLGEGDEAIRLAAIKAVEDTRLAKAAPRLARQLGEPGRPPAERAAVVRALRVLNDKAAVPVLQELLDGREPSSPEEVALRVETLRALGAIDLAAARERARRFVAHPNPALQGEAVLVLGSDAAGARQVGQWFLDKKLPRELLPQVSDALRRHAGRDAELAKLLAGVMKNGLIVSNTPAEVERARMLIASKGDPRRGRLLFLDSAAVACIKCHRLEGVGGNVGPDLTRVWETHTVEKLLEAILEPSKEIKEGYQTFEAATKQGQVFSGLKVSQTADEVVLRDANARDVRIAAKDLEALVPSKVSLMPDNAVAQLSYDQFIDLIAFLKDRAAQESLRGLGLEFWVVGPFGDDLRAAYPPEKQPDPLARYPGPKEGENLIWQAYPTEPTGYLNLRRIFNRDHITAYALTFVYSPKEQRVDLLLGSDDMVRVWLNGELVHEHGGVRSARPDEDRVSVTLRPGWNAVLAKVVNDSGGHGLYLRFRGGDGLRLALKPEGK